MSDITMDIHAVTSVTSQRKQLNGMWRLMIEATCRDGSVLHFTLYTPSADAASIRALPDEYVKVEEYEPAVARSDKPFSAPLSAGGSQ